MTAREQVRRGLDEVSTARSVVTIGVFDGVHRGHQAIVGRAVSLAGHLGIRAVALTFDPHPVEVVRPGAHPLLLTTVARRAELLLAAGVDQVVVLPFTPEFSRLTAEDFVASVLLGPLRTTAVVIGSNFRYGHRAAGDLEVLSAAGREHGFAVEGVPLVGSGGGTFSSSYIRERVTAGEVEVAALALGRPHRVDGTVVTGDRRGRALGYPTANLEPVPHAAIPADGVYAGRVTDLDAADLDPADLDPRAPGRAGWPAAVSIGTNPTFGGTSRRVEAYVLDRDDLDLYGRRLGVEFVGRIRDTLKFDSVEALLERMDADVAATRELLGRA